MADLLFNTEKLPGRLGACSLEEWLPDETVLGGLRYDWVNAHAHHDTNPWGWDGVRVLAELWSRGIGRVGMVAFDSGQYIDSVKAVAERAKRSIPCFIEALILTPVEGEEWNDLPGRAYFQAGPFRSSEDAKPLSDALCELAVRRARYQAACFKERLSLDFDYEPNWERLQMLGMTEANLARDLVDAVNSRSSNPLAVWQGVEGLNADPSDPNFARAFRTATMILDGGIAKVPRTEEFYMSTARFVELSGGRAWYMYVGKERGVEADRKELLRRVRRLGMVGVCAIPQRNLDTPEHARDFEVFLGLLEEFQLPTILGTELNAHKQWWYVDFSEEPFVRHREWLDRSWEMVL